MVERADKPRWVTRYRSAVFTAIILGGCAIVFVESMSSGANTLLIMVAVGVVHVMRFPRELAQRPLRTLADAPLEARRFDAENLVLLIALAGRVTDWITDWRLPTVFS